jgi:hypothetical protein
LFPPAEETGDVGLLLIAGLPGGCRLLAAVDRLGEAGDCVAGFMSIGCLRDAFSSSTASMAEEALDCDLEGWNSECNSPPSLVDIFRSKPHLEAFGEQVSSPMGF